MARLNIRFILIAAALLLAVAAVLIWRAVTPRQPAYTHEELTEAREMFNSALRTESVYKLLWEHDIYMTSAYFDSETGQLIVGVHNLTPELEQLLRDSIYDHPGIRFFSDSTYATRPL